MCGIWADFDFAVRFMVVSYMVTLCVLRLIVRYMAAIVRYMVDCAVYGYCAFYGLYSGSCQISLCSYSTEKLTLGGRDEGEFV